MHAKIHGAGKSSPIPDHLSGPASNPTAVFFAGLLMLSTLALMPLGEGAFNTAIAVMGVLGLIALVRSPSILEDRRVRLFMVLLACFLVPMVISLIGAIEPGRAARTTAAFLRFPVAAIFIIVAVRHMRRRHWIPIGVLAIAAVWSVDAMIQWHFGRNVLGMPYDGENLTGMFHPKRVIGLLLAGLLPILLDTAWRLTQRHRTIGGAAWGLVAFAPLVILLGGSRTSWGMMVIGIACWVAYRYIQSTSRYKSIVLVTALIAIAIATPLSLKLPGMETRVEQTRQLFKVDSEAVDEATSGRMDVWRIGFAIGRDHWLTGVGPRGYRYVYPDYADEETRWVSPDGETGAAHPHLTALEVFAETGVFGLIGFAIFWVILARAIWRLGNEDAWPWAICILIAFFPLNSHMAIYGTYWSHFSWWIVMVTVGMLGSSDRRESEEE